MEKESVRQVQIVKKGLFYYIFKLIGLPFKIIFWLFKYAGRNISSFNRDYQHYRKKKFHIQNLNKLMKQKHSDSEVI